MDVKCWNRLFKRHFLQVINCKNFRHHGLDSKSKYSCLASGACVSQKFIKRYFSKGRPPGGNRPLIDQKQVYKFNNWDNVVWDEEQEKEAKAKIAVNSSTLVEDDKKEKYEMEADKFWDAFYTQHQNRFFKDRHWLFTEFPELSPGDLPEGIPERAKITTSNSHKSESAACQQSTANAVQTRVDVGQDDRTETDCKSNLSDNLVTVAKDSLPSESHEDFPGAHSSYRIFEVGCGVGNTVFPVLQTNNSPDLFVYCCDLSSTAIELVREHADYTPARCHGFVCDITDPSAKYPFPEDSLDVIVLIFVLSAVHPDKMQETMNRLARFLKPGGLIVFRDYGRYDLAQLRFKNGRCLSDNFYVRGDGTRVYFFTQDELRTLFTKAGLEEEQNLIDRRLQVNRGKQLKMYRVWMQCKYRKPRIAK